jgi:hypothetical protein
MRIRYGTALVALVLAAGLTACGGGSEFKTKMADACKKDPGAVAEGAAVDCDCAAGVLDAELDADTKTFFLKMIDRKDEIDKDPAKMMEIMKDAGIDPTTPEGQKKAQDLMTKIAPAMTKVEEKCKKA